MQLLMLLTSWIDISAGCLCDACSRYCKSFSVFFPRGKHCTILLLSHVTTYPLEIKCVPVYYKTADILRPILSFAKRINFKSSSLFSTKYSPRLPSLLAYDTLSSHSDELSLT